MRLFGNQLAVPTASGAIGLIVGAVVAATLGGVSIDGQDRRVLNLRGDRFAPLTWEALSADQRTMVNDLLTGTRTSLNGPFNVLLRSPEMGNIAQRLGEYVRFRTSVPRRLNEMAILMTAGAWSSQYERVAHRSPARWPRV